MVGSKREILRPTSLQAALLRRGETGAVLFAGGTDLMVRYRGYTGTGPRIEGPVLFLDAVEELRGIAAIGNETAVISPGSPADETVRSGRDFLEIGAGCVLAKIESHPRVPELLRRAVALIAAPGLRNRATMAGNICNASPAGDSLPPLYVLEATVVLASVDGTREVAIEEFITGPGATILKENEIVTAIRMPLRVSDDGKTERLYYRKVGTRKANALSKLSGAGLACLDSTGVVTDFRLAFGAVAPTIVRLPEAEALVRGRHPDEIDTAELTAAYEPYIKPISDQRSTAEYRKGVALNMIEEFVARLRAAHTEDNLQEKT